MKNPNFSYYGLGMLLAYSFVAIMISVWLLAIVAVGIAFCF
jgi:hypothetical protein